jgi:hypothetical protein
LDGGTTIPVIAVPLYDAVRVGLAAVAKDENPTYKPPGLVADVLTLKMAALLGV